MRTTTATTTARPDSPGGGLVGMIAAEWTKLWSVRSTWWNLCGAVALMALFAAALGYGVAHPPADEPPRAELYPAQEAAVGGLVLTQFAFVALAVLVITAEYATGGRLAATLLWDPRRGRVLGAKVAVIVPVVLVTGTAVAALGAVVADLLAGDAGTFVLPDVAAEIARIGLYLSVAGLFALGAGTALRSTAGALTTVFLLLLLMPVVLSQTEFDLTMRIARYLPGTAGLEFVGASEVVGFADLPYGPNGGLAIFSAWAAAAVLTGYGVLRHRDA